MLRVVMSLDAEGAGRYFGCGLTAEEHYVSGVGVRRGKGVQAITARGRREPGA